MLKLRWRSRPPGNTMRPWTARPKPLPKTGKRDERLAKGQGLQWTKSFSFEGEARKNSSKLNEQCRNVYENKGSLWKTRERSQYVYEKTGA